LFVSFENIGKQRRFQTGDLLDFNAVAGLPGGRKNHGRWAREREQR